MYSINFLPGSKMLNSYFLAGFLTYSCLDRLPIFYIQTVAKLIQTLLRAYSCGYSP